MADAVYYFIVAKATDNGGNSLALTAVNGVVHVQLLDYSSEAQQWEKRKVTSRTDTQNPIFGLINRQTNTCVVRDGNHQGANLVLRSPDTCNFEELAMWRDEPSWGGINSYADWEQKINIPGNGPYSSGQQIVTWGYSGGAPNESWYYVQDNVTAELVSISFKEDLAKILQLPPVLFHTQVIENNSDVKQEGMETSYTTAIADNYSFTEEKGQKFTMSQGLSVKLPEIGVGMKVTFKEELSFTFSTKTATSTSRSMTVTFNPPVAPRSKVQCQAIVLNGKLDIPYTAVVKYTSPGKTPVQKSIAGVFTRVNAWHIESTTSKA